MMIYTNKLFSVTLSNEQETEKMLSGFIYRIKINLALKKKVAEFEGILDSGEYYLLIGCNNIELRKAYYVSSDKLPELGDYIGKCVDVNIKKLSYIAKNFLVIGIIKDETGKIKLDLGK